MAKPLQFSREGFSRRLQAEMDKFGVQQAALAIRLGISQAAVSGWFRRGFLPQPRILADLADSFGVTSKWFLTGEEPKLNERSRRAGEQITRLLPIPPNARVPSTVAEKLDVPYGKGGMDEIIAALDKVEISLAELRATINRNRR